MIGNVTEDEVMSFAALVALATNRRDPLHLEARRLMTKLLEDNDV